MSGVIMEWQGSVNHKLLRRGTKSEHRAVVLSTGSGEYKLRRVGGNPFVDEVLESLVGKRIRCTGRLDGDELFMDSWTVEE